MLDLALLRRDPDHVRRAVSRRGGDPGFVDQALALDESLRAARTTAEQLKSEKNAVSAAVGRSADRATEAARRKPELAALDERIAAAAVAVPPLDEALRALLAEVPNLLTEAVPEGADESANVVLRTGGERRSFAFTPKQHFELGEALGILDLERAAKLSGSRFAVLRGKGARLARALGAFFLDRAAARGYVELAPPVLVTRETMWSTGQLSKFADAMFRDESTDLFLIPTAEVPLTGLHRDEILENATLPIRYTALTSSFRKEAGAAGRDTRGLIRMHQFEKVELVALVRPEESAAALEAMTTHAASLLDELDLPYRVLALCAGDVGFNAAQTNDVEVWLPGQAAYREISSCSNCTDFQARRAQIRFRREAKGKPEFVHTLNGSGLPVGRTLVAVLENGQQADGSIRIPAALGPYCGFDAID